MIILIFTKNKIRIMTIHFYLERNKNVKSREKTIYCYIRGISKGRTIILNTKQKIDPEHWDKATEQAVTKGLKKDPAARELNDFLLSFKSEVIKIYRTFVAQDPTVDYEDIEQILLEEFGKYKRQVYTFFESFDMFIETRKRDMSHDSIRKFDTLKKHLLEFGEKNKFRFSFRKIDLLFYDKFLTYLIQNKKMKNNSAFKLIGLLKVFLNWSHDRGINGFIYFKKFKIKEDKVDIVTLSEEELSKLSELDLSNDLRLQRARDLFVFGCYTGGRFTDLVNVTREDILDGVWHLRVNKTRDILEIPLSDSALKILDRYSDDEHPLPIISNQKLNKYIKEVCQKAKINSAVKTTQYSGSKAVERTGEKWEFITVHTARRTFITLSLLKGMKAEIIMTISGHKNYKTFKKYVDITQSVKKDEINKAWNKNSLRLVRLPASS